MAVDAKNWGLTQILYLTIPPELQIGDTKTQAGSQWSKALDHAQRSDGLVKLYWGRRLEEPEKVQLHLVWSDAQSGQSFFSSRLDVFRNLTRDLTGANDIVVRHTMLRHQALGDPFGPSLLGYPIGTAIYKDTDAAWHEGAWPLWSHVVRHVDGCKGIAGGSVSEPVDGLENGYLVYVAWQTVKHHNDYHHTKHFWRHRVILDIGCQGWTEYGHVTFNEIRYGKGSSAL